MRFYIVDLVEKQWTCWQFLWEVIGDLFVCYFILVSMSHSLTWTRPSGFRKSLWWVGLQLLLLLSQLNFTIFIRTWEVNGCLREFIWKYFIIQAVLLATGKIFCSKEKNSLRIMLMWAHLRFTKWILITLWYKIFKYQLQLHPLQTWRHCGECGGDY